MVRTFITSFVLAQCGDLDWLLTPDLLQDAPTEPLPHQLAEAATDR
jgi:hypothetical protein